MGLNGFNLTVNTKEKVFIVGDDDTSKVVISINMISKFVKEGKRVLVFTDAYSSREIFERIVNLEVNSLSGKSFDLFADVNIDVSQNISLLDSDDLSNHADGLDIDVSSYSLIVAYGLDVDKTDGEKHVKWLSDVANKYNIPFIYSASKQQLIFEDEVEKLVDKKIVISKDSFDVINLK